MNNSNQTISDFWKSNANVITKLLAALLFLIALYILAKLVWLWLGHGQVTTAPTANAKIEPSVANNNVNVNKIVQKNLFGAVDATEEAVEEVSGETSLSLKLIGVYVDSNDQLSSAIIRSANNKEKVYWIGDKLDGVGSRRVELKKVEALRVIIRNGTRNETLTLLENLNKQVLDSRKAVTAAENTNSKTIDKRRDSRLTKDLTDIRDKLTQSPQSFADLARFEMITDNSGQVSGFKIAPGKDPRMFSRLGLRRNDVVKAINGNPLSNNGYFTMLEQLQSSESLEVSIERNGQPITLLLNLGAGQSSNSQNDEPRTGNTDLKFQ